MVIKKRVQIEVFARLDAFRAVYFELSTPTRLKTYFIFQALWLLEPNFCLSRQYKHKGDVATYFEYSLNFLLLSFLFLFLTPFI